MSDEKPKRRGWWGSDTRDVLSDKARRERAKSEHDQVSQLADAVENSGDAKPYREMGDPDTSPTERIKGDPDLALLALRDEHTRQAMVALVEKARRDAADRIVDALGEKPPAEQMSALERTIRRLRVVIIAVAIPAASSLMLVSRYLYARGAADERAAIELQEMKDKVDETVKELNEIKELAHRTETQLEDLQRERDRARARDVR